MTSLYRDQGHAIKEQDAGAHRLTLGISTWYGMASDPLAGLNDIALPDLDELQIPSDFTFNDFDESGLLGDPPSLFINDEAGLQQSEQPGLEHLSWLPSALSDGHSQASQGATTSADHDQKQARSSPTEKAAGPKGRFERKAEQNRCAADGCDAGKPSRRLRSRAVFVLAIDRGVCAAACRRAYQRYRERQKQQKEDDKRTIEAMDRQIQTLQAERAELAHRIEMLQKVRVALAVAIRCDAECALPPFSQRTAAYYDATVVGSGLLPFAAVTPRLPTESFGFAARSFKPSGRTCRYRRSCLSPPRTRQAGCALCAGLRFVQALPPTKRLHLPQTQWSSQELQIGQQQKPALAMGL